VLLRTTISCCGTLSSSGREKKKKRENKKKLFWSSWFSCHLCVCVCVCVCSWAAMALAWRHTHESCMLVGVCCCCTPPPLPPGNNNHITSGRRVLGKLPLQQRHAWARQHGLEQLLGGVLSDDEDVASEVQQVQQRLGEQGDAQLAKLERALCKLQGACVCACVPCPPSCNEASSTRPACVRAARMEGCMQGHLCVCDCVCL
jgi:hypothetical protein